MTPGPKTPEQVEQWLDDNSITWIRTEGLTVDGMVMSLEVSNRFFAGDDRYYVRVMGTEGSGWLPPLGRPSTMWSINESMPSWSGPVVAPCPVATWMLPTPCASPWVWWLCPC